MSNIKKNEWRAIIHFLQKEGLSPTEAAKKLKLHYGDSAPDRSTVSRWMSRFTSGSSPWKMTHTVVLQQQQRLTLILILLKPYLMEIDNIQ